MLQSLSSANSDRNGRRESVLDFVSELDEELQILPDGGVLVLEGLLYTLAEFPMFEIAVYALKSRWVHLLPVVGLYPFLPKDGMKQCRPRNDHQDHISSRAKSSTRTVVGLHSKECGLSGFSEVRFGLDRELARHVKIPPLRFFLLYCPNSPPLCADEQVPRKGTAMSSAGRE